MVIYNGQRMLNQCPQTKVSGCIVVVTYKVQMQQDVNQSVWLH
jgi:hypothetical protein